MNGLSFFSPGYLWALLFLAVPIAIHFFNRKKTIRIDFSSLRFFRETAVKANRARNIRRLLQLLARLAIALLLVVIFARPYSPVNPFTILKNPQVTVYCWLDPTISMDYRDGTWSCLQQARMTVDSIAKKLPATARIECYDEQRNGFEDLSELPSSAMTRYGKPPIEEMMAAFVKEQRASPNPAVLVLLSDFQEGIAGAVAAAIKQDSLKVPMLLVSVSPSAPWNAGLRAAVLSSENASQLTINSYAIGKAVESAPVYAMAKGMRIGHSTVSLKPGDTAGVHMDIAADIGMDGGSVRLDIADPFPADNTTWFIRQGTGQGTVLIAGDEKESFPIASALRAVPRNQPVKVVVKPVDKIVTEDLESAAVLVLNGLEYLSPVLESFLSVSSSRKAVIFSPRLSAQAMTLNRHIMSRFKPALPMAIDSSVRGYSPVLTDTLSALWKGFPQKTDRDVAVNRYLRDIPGTVLIRLDNSRPFAVSNTDQNGNTWVVCASGLGATGDNNLCETGFYVPFLDRILRHAASGTNAALEPWIAGIPRQNPYYGRRAGAQVFDAGNGVVAQWESQPMVVFDRPGLYKVQPFGEPAYWLQAVPDPDEVNLQYHIPASQPPRIKVVSAGECPAFIDSCGNTDILRILWALIVFFLLAEIALWDWGMLLRKPVKT